jgi:hypothetical protein
MFCFDKWTADLIDSFTGDQVLEDDNLLGDHRSDIWYWRYADLDFMEMMSLNPIN